MTDTNATPARGGREQASNGMLRGALVDSTELRHKVEEAATDLATTVRKEARRQGRMARREARALYRESTRTIKRNPWRTVGLTLLTGIVAGGLVALARRPQVRDSDA